MGFVDELKDWLRAYEAGRDVVHTLDLEGLRTVLGFALEGLPEAKIGGALLHWTPTWRLPMFAERVALGLHSGPVPWDPRSLQTGVEAAVTYRVCGAVPMPESPLRSKLIVRAADDAFRRLLPTREYALENRLVDRTGAVTRLGRTLLNLVGREAVVFVLEMETGLSTGPDDPHHISRGALAAVRSTGIARVQDEGEDEFVWSSTSLERLSALGPVRHEIDAYVDRWTVHPEAEPLLDEVLSSEMTPMRALVRALLGEAFDASLDNAPPAELGPGGWTDLDYAEIVVHEVRNILGPVQIATRNIWRALEADEQDAAQVGEWRERVDRGLARLAEFAKQTAGYVHAAREEPVSLRVIVADAIDASAPDRNGRIAVDDTSVEEVRIQVHRQRWVLAFVNLLRNAAQSRQGAGNVWISTAWTSIGTLQIHVDDDGNGVPAELRESIFLPGVSTRGGSGQGLALVRATVERARGHVVCVASPRGGARFTLSLPTRKP